MLRELHISNLAVIEDAAIELAEGLNCFTGQTGAGKSLIIGAFEVLLGLRGAGNLLRGGCEEGRVSGVFDLNDAETIRQLNEAADLDLEPSSAHEQLLITRKLFTSGRTSVSINGQPATAVMLRQIGELLVDVHGQHDHQFLLKPAHQLLMLDRFAELEDLRRRFAETHRQLHELKQRQVELEASAALRKQQLELYEFQADEIDRVEPTEGEYEELGARYKLLNNLQRIARESTAAYHALYEGEGAIVERLQAVLAILRDLAELDAELQPIRDDIHAAASQLQDASFTLSRYSNRLELDEEELAETEQRLNALNRLIAKYADHGGTLEQVIAYRAQIGGEIDQLRARSDDMQSIAQQIAPLAEQLQQLGEELTKKRKAATKKLKPLIEEQLAELGMAEAKLDAAFERTDPQEIHSPTGFDAVELLIQPNPGQPARPLRQIASGGELSRVMLAIKSILASADRVSVLVFDEVDANIGGRMGSVIGSKLRKLADTHQVLCITHLPQIAAYADRHMKIDKRVAKGRTATHVSALDDGHRLVELAEMLSGKDATATTRQQAEEMLALANGRKA